jgi:hypothetical protein
MLKRPSSEIAPFMSMYIGRTADAIRRAADGRFCLDSPLRKSMSSDAVTAAQAEA